MSDPKPKRPRKTLLDKFLDNVSERLGQQTGLREDEITPPSSPAKDQPLASSFFQRGSNSGTPSSVRSFGDREVNQGSKVKRSLRVFTRQPEGDSMAVTGHDGSRVYLKMNEQVEKSGQDVKVSNEYEY